MRKAVVNLVLFAACVLFGIHPACATTTSLRLYHASYAVSRNGFQIGVADFTLRRNRDGSYDFQSVTHATGLAALFFSDVVTESSHFQIKDGQLEPMLYEYTHSGGDHGRSEKIRFDWTARRADSVDGKQHKSIAIEPGIYDRALAQLAISLDVANDRLADVYRVLDHGEISSYRMERDDDVRLSTRAGKFQTLKVARKDSRKKRVTTFWLGTTLDYLPVKIEQTEPGKATIDLVLIEIKFDSAEPSRLSGSQDSLNRHGD